MKKNYIQPAIEKERVYSMSLCQVITPSGPNDIVDTKQREEYEHDDNKSTDYGNLW
ncbi:MAG: hypothetical protein II415_02820 [Bacteroidaceae bacterium]|nr:hypothetical protein [Bacteroidaceae bacterium]